MSDPKRLKRVLPLAILAAVAVVGLVVFLMLRHGGAPDGGPPVPIPPRTAPANAIAFDLSGFDETPVAALWLDVHQPAKARQAIAGNEWLQKVLKEPLGQGFVGSWAGFLGTRGEDAGGLLSGTVLDLVADQLLTIPFQLVWFGGRGAAGTPALVISKPNASVLRAFNLLDRIATHGGYTATRCPGAPEPKGAAALEPPSIVVARWSLANHTVFGAARGERLVIGRHPVTALLGLCAQLAPMEPAEDVDLELAVAAEPMGREAQMLARTLGLEKVARFDFGLEGTQLVPRGIRAQLSSPDPMGAEAIPEALLKMIPEAMPVMLLAQPKLPEKLDAESLQAHFAGKEKGALLARQVALLWSPRGDPSAATEVALLWPRLEDEPGLRAIFSGGGNQMIVRRACGGLVLASVESMAERVEASCSGRAPSMLNAAGPVVAGLEAPTSVGLGVNLGRLLSGLTLDGYQAEEGNGSVPQEIEDARRRLEELPFMGLRGVARQKALVPGGFKS